MRMYIRNLICGQLCRLKFYELTMIFYQSNTLTYKQNFTKINKFIPILGRHSKNGFETIVLSNWLKFPIL